MPSCWIYRSNLEVILYVCMMCLLPFITLMFALLYIRASSTVRIDCEEYCSSPEEMYSIPQDDIRHKHVSWKNYSRFDNSSRVKFPKMKTERPVSDTDPNNTYTNNTIAGAEESNNKEEDIYKNIFKPINNATGRKAYFDPLDESFSQVETVSTKPTSKVHSLNETSRNKITFGEFSKPKSSTDVTIGTVALFVNSTESTMKSTSNQDSTSFEESTRDGTKTNKSAGTVDFSTNFTTYNPNVTQGETTKMDVENHSKITDGDDGKIVPTLHSTATVANLSDNTLYLTIAFPGSKESDSSFKTTGLITSSSTTVLGSNEICPKDVIGTLEFPFVVSIIRGAYVKQTTEPKLQYLCAGVIVSLKCVISSTECFDYSNVTIENIRRYVFIRSGSSYWYKEGVIHDIDQVHYASISNSTKKNQYVIAIIVKNNFMNLSTIQPVLLPESLAYAEDAIGLVFSWFSRENWTLEPVQAKAMRMVQDLTCLDYRSSESVFCGEDFEENDFCNHLKGAPLVEDDTLVGIHITVRCEESSYVQYFVDIGYYLEWLTLLL